MNYNIKLIQSGNSEEQYGILVDHQIGRGTFGKVYKVINLRDPSEKLAVKVIPLPDSSKKSEVEREFDIIKQLPQHPNLIQFKPFKYLSENNVYMLMEYCRSNLYQEIMRREGKRMEESRVLDLVYQLVSGYKVLFDSKILHQDIKPQNILIKDGVYKLADFGLSVFYESYDFDTKREGAVGYIAPQKIFTKNYKGNPKSDVYSLGIVIYEVVTGKHPYLVPDCWNSNLPMMEIMKQLMEVRVQTPYNILGQYSLGFNEVWERILQMIERSETKRISFQSLYQFVCTSPLFNDCKKLKKRQSGFQESRYPISNNWTVKEVSEILVVPFDASDDQEENIIKKHQETKSLKQKTQNEECIQKLTKYILDRRLVVYFLDRVARRLIVRKMNGMGRSVESKAILHLILFSKSITTEILSEIQAPKKYTFLEWKIFGNSQEKKLIDLVLKDNRHLQGTVCDTFIEDKHITKNDIKSANLLYRGGGKESQIGSLQSILLETVKQIGNLIDSSSTSSLITLLLVLKAHDIVGNKEFISQQLAEIQDYNRFLEDKSHQQLMDAAVLQCETKSVLVSFDFSDEII